MPPSNINRSDYINKIKNLYEVDMGDFKRKALSYLNRWEEEKLPEDINLIHKLKNHIISTAINDIEVLRSEILTELEKTA